LFKGGGVLKVDDDGGQVYTSNPKIYYNMDIPLPTANGENNNSTKINSV